MRINKPHIKVLIVLMLVLPPASIFIKSTNIVTIDNIALTNSVVERYTINKIKEHEGLRLKRYKCAAGYWTIGYGHRIKSNEHYTQITLEKAEQLLISDFRKAEISAIRLSPILIIYPYRRYAISHFIYGKGSGSYAKSGLRRAVNHQLPIETEIRKWNKITSNGKTYSSKYLSDINEWRIQLYNYELVHSQKSINL